MQLAHGGAGVGWGRTAGVGRAGTAARVGVQVAPSVHAAKLQAQVVCYLV